MSNQLNPDAAVPRPTGRQKIIEPERLCASDVGDTALRLYLQEISEVKRLTPRAEIALAKRIKQGDKRARGKIIKTNLGLVVKIARDHEGRGLPLLDLVSEGNIGLIKAVGRFDPAKAGKLATCALQWIKRSITRALANQAQTVAPHGLSAGLMKSQMEGNTAWFTPPSPQGCPAYVRGPTGTARPGEPSSAQARCRAASANRILVADDDSGLRMLYGFVLSRPGYLVDVAEDGAAAWVALQANRYHLLITEHEMPNLTGVELVKKLRAARMALPVVMAARKLPIEELARYPSLQLAATLVKPFLADALLDTVKNVLRLTDRAHEPIEPLPIWRSQPSAQGLQAA
jgi:RNA polymerase sigma factor (sigma-70 family)